MRGFFLDTRAYVFDYGSGMEEENKPSDFSKTEMTHSRYKDTGLCSRVCGGEFILISEIRFFVVFYLVTSGNSFNIWSVTN